jgi:hypothetical protein
MTLIGDAANFLPHLIAAWVRAGERGAGKGRCRFDLCVVDRFLPDGNMDRIYDSGKVINYEPVALPLADYFNGNPLAPPWTIAIKTPLRFRLKGKNAQIMDWGEAFKALAIRLSVMGQQYAGGSRLSKLAWDELMHFLKAPGAIENETHWYDWKRFSSSQRTHVYMGGLVGRSTVLPSRATPVWWQWWKAAELFHLGKATCMGLGSIKILN